MTSNHFKSQFGGELSNLMCCTSTTSSSIIIILTWTQGDPDGGMTWVCLAKGPTLCLFLNGKRMSNGKKHGKPWVFSHQDPILMGQLIINHWISMAA